MLLEQKVKNKTPEQIQEMLNDAWLNIYVNKSTLYNPMLNVPKSLEETPHLYFSWLMMQPEYFSFVCKELFNIKILPTQAVILKELWNRRFPMLIASRGFGKSFMLAVYALLRAILMPSRKIVICGAAFRQSKVVFDYINTIWNNSPLLRDIIGTSTNSGPKYLTDMCKLTVRDSQIIALPIGDGSKIRGQRATDIIGDEFASIPRDIFENVIAGFAAVKSAPVDNVVEEAKKKLARLLKIQYETEDDGLKKDNQIIISGTAYYDFNHFGEYWKRWKQIITSRGDIKKLETLFRDTDIPEDFNWKDYSIIRLPYELVPKGFMDAAQVARSKATIHSGIYLMEFGAVFTNDSNGFFKRSLIENCVVGHNNEIYVNSLSEPVMFNAMLRGNPNKKYIFGIDPASEVDNFSIVILEQNIDHRKVVYCWTTNRTDHKEKIKAGVVSENDFYSYCARKIRDLMTTFPCDRLAIDSQGGGIAIIEALHDTDKIDFEKGEQPIWPIIDPTKPADTDGERGLHIIVKCNFASADWTSEANHGLRKDLEDKFVLFPAFDAVTIGLSRIQDDLGNKIYDTLEDCVLDIEELKDELSTIIISQTTNGRDRWDTPEVKLPGGKKGRLRKDRYSALIMANMVGRQMHRNQFVELGSEIGGWVNLKKEPESKSKFVGPAWSTEALSELYN